MVPLFEDAQTTLACDDIDDDASLLLQMPAELAVRVLGYCSIEGRVPGRRRVQDVVSEVDLEILCEVLCGATGAPAAPSAGRGFRQMLARRDRVRLSGFYALRQSRSKPVRRDMWTPKPRRSSLLGRGGVVALPAVLCGREFAVLLVHANPRAAQAVARLARQKTRARDDSEAPPGRGEDAPRRLRAQTGRRRGDGPRAARRGGGFCLTLTHGARGRGVGLDLDRHSQVETVRLVSTTACPRTSAPCCICRVGLGGPFLNAVSLSADARGAAAVVALLGRGSVALFLGDGAWIPG